MEQNSHPTKNGITNQIFTLGLISLILSWTGIPGLILGILGTRQCRKFSFKNSLTPARFRFGKSFSVAGLAVSIFFTLFWVISFVLLTVALISSLL